LFVCLRLKLCTPLSECRPGKAPPRPYLGPKSLKTLAPKLFYWKGLGKRSDSSIQNENFMENDREIEVSDFGFRSTFNEGGVVLRCLIQAA
jgi:hypothetical protein